MRIQKSGGARAKVHMQSTYVDIGIVPEAFSRENFQHLEKSVKRCHKNATHGWSADVLPLYSI